MTAARLAGGAAAWVGQEIAGDTDWVLTAGTQVNGDLLHAVGMTTQRVVDGGETIADAVGALGPAGEWSPAVARLAASVLPQLLDGRGFALVRGLPVDDLSSLERDVLCWIVCSQIGVPIHQNPARDQIVRVRDEGKDFAEPGVRSYETAAPLDYHSDSSDVVALYCVRPAMQGGVSTIVSSVAVHDAVATARPDLVDLLFADWPQASPVDRRVRHAPICAWGPRGGLSTRYGRHYIDTAAAYDTSVVSLTPDQHELLDVYDRVLRDPQFALDMSFRPGDIQFLNNYVVMHARTDYADWPDPERRRELLRMWLVIRDGVDLPDVFADSGFVPRSVALG